MTPAGLKRPAKTASLYFDRSSSIGKLLLDGLRFFLGDAFFHRLRSAVDQVLGFFQAEGGDFAYCLDDIDLIGTHVLKNDREFGLLFSRGRTCRCTTTTGNHHRGSRCG